MSTAETSPPTLSRSGDWATESRWSSRIRGLLKYGPVLVGGVLLYAAFQKALSPALTLESLGWAFAGYEWPILLTLIVVEVVLGACLIFHVWPRWTMTAAFVLLAVFLSWLIYLQATNAPVPCGCGMGQSATDAESLAHGRLLAMARVGALFLAMFLGVLGERCLSKSEPLAEGDQR